MGKEVIVKNNGSTWGGQPMSSIPQLIQIMKKEVIEESFFSNFRKRYGSDERVQMCPIINEGNGWFRFFGNFENLSHVFDIRTNNPEVIQKLRDAIKGNEGWSKYYEKNLIKEHK